MGKRKGACGYVYVWAFTVREGATTEFERLYGPEGGWVGLFRRAEGHLGTDLHRDVTAPNRYLTVDRWESEAVFRAFRASFAAEFEALEAAGEKLTTNETEIGRFDLLE